MESQRNQARRCGELSTPGRIPHLEGGKTHGRRNMPKYLITVSYTAEGAKGVLKDGGSKRRQAAEQVIKSAGGRMEAFYFAFGADDAYIIVDAPDHATVCHIACRERIRRGSHENDRASHTRGDRSGDQKNRELSAAGPVMGGGNASSHRRSRELTEARCWSSRARTRSAVQRERSARSDADARW